MSQIDDTIEAVKKKCGFQVVSGTTWNDGDFSRFAELTGLAIPNQLADVLRRYGQSGTEYNDYFLVEDHNGGRFVHDVQVLISTFDIIVERHETFISRSVWRTNSRCQWFSLALPTQDILIFSPTGSILKTMLSTFGSAPPIGLERVITPRGS
ncbi:hypothetical protein PVA19_03010 [Agrobacterium sp. CNPSo 3708]|uniref:hypothetical protein n=1 Tax=Agrobacterium sp. CNPSo 3708 TaxID=3028150 RepID=UPI002363F9CA|nr:hypothetical protein [Agrobacterium sp. CNPSo 3708]MDD1497368.1 hypothetical protein [Agrobacterium sp. CNPSo 3708]